MASVIPAIILAAGASSRMGQPKALLRAGDRTFVRCVLDALRGGGIDDAVVIVRPAADEIVREVERGGFGRTVTNPDPGRGQLSSLVAGLDAIDGVDVRAALVTLVDVPLVRASTISTLLARARSTDRPIVRAVCGGRHGHPVVFARSLFAELRAADPETGAKSVVRLHDVDDVELGDPGVLRDVDTPADYARLFS
jgi:CTP:molybdopterin cytidylyltransferase MocA